MSISMSGTEGGNSTGAVTASQQANAINSKALLLPRTSAAFAGVRAGVRNGRIICIGDSTTLGVWSAGGLLTGDMKPRAFPAQLAAYLNASGINAHANSFMGVGNASAAAPSNYVNDSRLVIGSAWTPHTFPTVGGPYFKASAATNPLAFTPTQNVDTFNIFYPTQTGVSFGKFNAKINAGSATVFDENTGSATFVSAIGTITGVLGINTLNILWDSVNTAFITGAEAYDSSKKWVSVINAGWSGAKTSDIIASNGLLGLPGMAADLTIINAGLNDMNQSVPVATFSANLQSIITSAKAGGSSDVLLMTSNPQDATLASIAIQNSFHDAVVALAVSNNCALVDYYTRFGTYTSANSLSLMGDLTHPNQAGYDIGAGLIQSTIGSI